MVIWITGLSGAGKTTIAAAFARQLRDRGIPIVLLDGDSLRAIIQDSALGFDRQSRLRNAWRMSRMAHHIAAQGVPVVVATMSLFHEIQAWNRAHLPSYCEVLIHATLEHLKARDPLGLYRNALDGKIRDVVGIDQSYELPLRPDLILDNSRHDRTPDVMAHEIIQFLERSALISNELQTRLEP